MSGEKVCIVGHSTTALLTYDLPRYQKAFGEIRPDAGILAIFGYSGAPVYDITRYFFQGCSPDPGRRRERAERMRRNIQRLRLGNRDVQTDGNAFTHICIEMGMNDLEGQGLRNSDDAALRLIRNLQTAYREAGDLVDNIMGVTIPPALGCNGWCGTNERARNLVNRWIRGEIALITGDGGRISEIIELDDYGQRVEQGSIDPEADNVIAPPNISAVINLDPLLIENPDYEGYESSRRARTGRTRDGLRPRPRGQDMMESYEQRIHDLRTTPLVYLDSGGNGSLKISKESPEILAR